MRIDRRLLSQVQTARLQLGLSVGLNLLGGALLVAQAMLVSRAISGVFVQGKTLSEVVGLLWVSLAVIAGRALVLWGGHVAAGQAAGHIKHDLRTRLLTHLVALGPAYTGGERTGELVTTLTEGIEQLDAYFRQYLPRLALVALIPSVILLVVFPVDLLSGIILLVTAPLIPIFMLLIGNLADGVQRKQWKTLSFLGGHFLDVVQGLPTLKLFGRSKAQREIIDYVSERFRIATMSVLRVAFLSALVLEMVVTLSTAIVAVEIAVRLLSGRIAFEQALLILILAPDFYLPMRALGASFHAATAGATAAERIFEVLGTPVPTPNVRITDTDEDCNVASQPIRFVGVSFAYDEGEADHERHALHHVSFEIAPGETIALIGPSGAGKSSIAHLLLRFIRAQQGVVRIGDRLLNEIPLRTWRQQVAWVPQSPYLFNASIAENIRLGHPDATPDEIRYAAMLAHAHEFINALPEGYGTRVGERGARLSGGEAQRIALARAFLVNAPLIILDEATAHLDPRHQAMIHESMRQLLHGRTALIIAHHLSTIAIADRIVVLDRGHIIEAGTHDVLMARQEFYHDLVTAHQAST